MAYTTIDNPKNYYDQFEYQGNETARSFKNLKFSPGLNWTKPYNNSGAHVGTDSQGGYSRFIELSSNGAGQTGSNNITSLDTNGYSLGTANDWNIAADTFVSYNWKAGSSATDVAESGSNPGSAHRAETTAGFSVMLYTGTGSAGNVTNGLGVVPKFMMVKNRDVNDTWAVYHYSKGPNFGADLNSTAVFADDDGLWNDTTPTATVFTVGDDHRVNADGEKYIAYLWNQVPGYSKMDYYIGNGNANGQFVHLGFKPAWLMIKSIITDAEDWWIFDTVQNPNIGTQNRLGLSTGNAVTTNVASGADNVDLLSNGFKMVGLGGGANSHDLHYMYVAFAESPFVTSGAAATTGR